MWNTELASKLKIKYPIIQAPMAGGITTTKLVVTVSDAGGLGMIGAGYLAPEQLRNQIREIKNQTSKPFGVNLFIPTEMEPNENEIKKANNLLKSIREKLGVPDEKFSIENIHNHFNEQLEIALEVKVAVCSFTFGLPETNTVEKLKEEGIFTIGTATTVKEAIMVEDTGMDAIVLQGSEAGGHRGTFIGGTQSGLIGLMSLIPQAADQVRIPVIASGGIMDGRGLLAALCLGAQAVQLGTALLTCEESGAHPMHKEAIINSSEDDTVITRAFSGKPARGINNEFITNMAPFESDFPAFPVQNTLTTGLRKAAALQNNPEYMSLWAGQSLRLAKAQSVKELINNIISDAEVQSFKIMDR
ncbi:NAD(P)H-dependent flavin oxidoreductase [Bacillus sp. T33-2]|uniref:NAD(P)H-dependent flavin oxidoreductase n=1 Tax=Bacillus sp. T33-2 TaxID=2054168 RepID=UPI000C793C34|nr:nitronate monooxygenase [Bacillus sp. T33-2]PLR94176.1 nitronate monooxygenase [Bacillus sp. T33-2]